MPPVSANPACDARSRVRQTAQHRLSNYQCRSRRAASPALAVTASIEALPQTPQLEVV